MLREEPEEAPFLSPCCQWLGDFNTELAAILARGQEAHREPKVWCNKGDPNWTGLHLRLPEVVVQLLNICPCGVVTTSLLHSHAFWSLCATPPRPFLGSARCASGFCLRTSTAPAGSVRPGSVHWRPRGPQSPAKLMQTGHRFSAS